MKRANRWLGWLAAAVLGFGGVLPDARAETETVDGIPWTYTVSGGVATVVGIPASTTGAIAIPSALGGCPVTDIGSFAFHNHGGLTGVTIGAGVTNVASYAFSFCTNLVSMAIADGVARIEPYALYKCRGMRSLEVPGAWYGTGIVAEALWEPPWFPVTYRGIDPLSVAVEGLPAAKEGEAFAAALEAAGGVALHLARRGGPVRGVVRRKHLRGDDIAVEGLAMVRGRALLGRGIAVSVPVLRRTPHEGENRQQRGDLVREAAVLLGRVR